VKAKLSEACGDRALKSWRQQFTLRFQQLVWASMLSWTAIALSGASIGEIVPASEGGVADRADLLSAEVETELNELLAQLQRYNGSKIAVVTVADLSPYPDAQTFADGLAEHWGMDRPEGDAQVLLVVSRNLEQIAIETTPSLQRMGVEIDNERILAGAMAPFLETNDWEGAIVAGTRSIADRLYALDEEFKPPYITWKPWIVAMVFTSILHGIGWLRYRAHLDRRKVFVPPTGYVRLKTVGDLAEPLTTGIGHGGPIAAIATTPDGRRALSASSDGTVRVWDVGTGVEIYTLSGHSEAVSAIAVTSDGKFAISGAEDGTIEVWDLETGKLHHSLDGHGDRVVALKAVSRDRAISASWDKTLKVWDLETGVELRRLDGHGGAIADFALLPRRRLICASYDRKLHLWDWDSGVHLYALEGHRDFINRVAVTPDGWRAISTSDDKTVKVWDLQKGELLFDLVGHGQFVTDVAVVGDRVVVSASDDTTLKVWDLYNGRSLHTLYGHQGKISAILSLPGKRFISASWDGTLKIWNWETGQVLRTLTDGEDRVNAIALLPWGRVISGSGDRSLKVWDLDSTTLEDGYGCPDPILHCLRCKSALKPLSEKQLQRRLTPSQQLASRLGSTLFEGWICPKCRSPFPEESVYLHAEIVPSGGFDYCPHCQELTATIEVETVREPTWNAIGIERIIRSCHGCQDRDTFEVTVPPLSLPEEAVSLPPHGRSRASNSELNRPVHCQCCHYPMDPVDPQVLSVLLTNQERSAQNLGSMEFIGWECPTPHGPPGTANLHIRGYVTDAQRFRSCPKCGGFTVVTDIKLLDRPTPTHNGRQRSSYTCNYCAYHWEIEGAIVVSTPPTLSDSLPYGPIAAPRDYNKNRIETPSIRGDRPSLESKWKNCHFFGN